MLLMLLEKMGNCITNPIEHEIIDNENYIYQNFELIDNPQKTYIDSQQRTNFYQETQMQQQPIQQNQNRQMQPQLMQQNPNRQMQPHPMQQNPNRQMQQQPMQQNPNRQMQPQPMQQNPNRQMQPQPMQQNPNRQMQPQPMQQNQNGQMQPQPTQQNPNGQMQPQPTQKGPDSEHIVETPTDSIQQQKINEDKKEILEIFSVALDSLLYDDSSIKYIALDLNNHMCINFSNEDKLEIIKYFEEYGLEVFNNSLPSLKILGKTDDNNAIEGIILTLTNLIFMREDTVIIEGYRYQNADTVVGFRNQICKENEKWVIKDRKKLWD